MKRARLIAVLRRRCDRALAREMRLGRILPRSGMKFWRSLTSFQSMWSCFSRSGLTFARR